MEKQDFQTVFPDANPMGKNKMQKFQFKFKYSFLFLAIDLMEKMLEVDSDKRINAAQTLSHPYLEEVGFKFFSMIMLKHFVQYADPSDEPTAPFYDQTFEDYDLTVDVWKGKV